jgi:translin
MSPPPQGFGEPQGSAPVGPEGFREPQGGAPVGREQVSGADRTREGVQGRFEAKSQAREAALARARLAVRRAANAIRAVHRGELAAADRLLVDARQLLDVAESLLAAHPDVYYAGFLQNAQKEYAEARATRALVAGQPLPEPEEVAVGDAPYLNGLAETIGELRRHLLDVLRAGDVARANELFDAMEGIHSLLADVDYPDAITGGLRRSTDVARAVIERTRSDLTLTTIQRDLADALRRGGDSERG